MREIRKNRSQSYKRDSQESPKYRNLFRVMHPSTRAQNPAHPTSIYMYGEAISKSPTPTFSLELRNYLELTTLPPCAVLLLFKSRGIF